MPYSVNIISSDLIENTIARSAEDVFKISPVVQPTIPYSRSGTVGPVLRGFALPLQSYLQDGLAGSSPDPVALEDKERVEIYTGLTGFLFGPTVVGGMINYVYKTPTEKPLANITIGDYGYLQGFAHGDFSGPIDKDGQFSYRLNIVEQHGNTPIDSQSIDKQLVTAVLDWHIAPNTLLEVIGTHEYEDIHSLGSNWFPLSYSNGASKFNYGWVPDPSKLYSQTYTSTPYEIDRAEAKLTSKLNDIFSLRTAYAFQSRYIFGAVYDNNDIYNNTGLYDQYSFRNTGLLYQTNSAYAFVDAQINSILFEHKITAGYYGYNTTLETGAGGASPLVYTYGLNYYSSPVSLPPPNLASALSYYGQRYTTSITGQNNFVVGDELKFNDYFSALLGGNYAMITARSFNSTPPYAQSSSYDKGKITPSFSLIFKPVPWVSTYATYSESMEQGQIVPSTGSVIYTNGGDVLPPFIDKEVEIGTKANIGGMLVTAALFDINKALQYAVNNNNGTFTYVQDGREVHKGFEFTATGNVWEGFRVLGGVTLLDPRVTAC